MWNTHESGRQPTLPNWLKDLRLSGLIGVGISAGGAKSLAGRKTPRSVRSTRTPRLSSAAMSAPVARHDPYASLRIPNFRWFIISLLTMNVATQLQAVVVSWQVYALTRDPLSLGLIGLAEALPFIGFALPAGHLADRVSRLRIARVALAPAGLLAPPVGSPSGPRSSIPVGSGRSMWSSCERDRAELSAAVPHGAKRGGGAACCTERRDVAQLDMAARRGAGTGARRPHLWIRQ